MTYYGEITGIISSLGSRVVTEKFDYQQFLELLTSCLDQLDQLNQHIRTTSNENVVVKKRV